MASVLFATKMSNNSGEALFILIQYPLFNNSSAGDNTIFDGFVMSLAFCKEYG